MALDSGVLQLTIESARGLKEGPWFGKRDPYCIVRVGSRTFRTRTHVDGGRDPVWNQTFHIPVGGEDACEALIRDDDADGSDGMLGRAFFSLAAARRQGSDRPEVPVLSARSGKRRGLLAVALRWAPMAEQAAPQAPQQQQQHFTTGHAHPQHVLQPHPQYPSMHPEPHHLHPQPSPLPACTTPLPHPHSQPSSPHLLPSAAPSSPPLHTSPLTRLHAPTPAAPAASSSPHLHPHPHPHPRPTIHPLAPPPYYPAPRSALLYGGQQGGVPFPHSYFAVAQAAAGSMLPTPEPSAPPSPPPGAHPPHAGGAAAGGSCALGAQELSFALSQLASLTEAVSLAPALAHAPQQQQHQQQPQPHTPASGGCSPQPRPSVYHSPQHSNVAAGCSPQRYGAPIAGDTFHSSPLYALGGAHSPQQQQQRAAPLSCLTPHHPPSGCQSPQQPGERTWQQQTACGGRQSAPPHAAPYRPSTQHAAQGYHSPSTQHAAQGYHSPSTQHAAQGYHSPSTQHAAQGYHSPAAAYAQAAPTEHGDAFLVARAHSPAPSAPSYSGPHSAASAPPTPTASAPHTPAYTAHPTSLPSHHSTHPHPHPHPEQQPQAQHHQHPHHASAWGAEGAGAPKPPPSAPPLYTPPSAPPLCAPPSAPPLCAPSGTAPTYAPLPADPQRYPSPVAAAALAAGYSGHCPAVGAVYSY